MGVRLSCLHEGFSSEWMLTAAHEVGSSRTVLAERFAEVIGIPPMQYLTQWRFQLAAADFRRERQQLSLALPVAVPPD